MSMKLTAKVIELDLPCNEKMTLAVLASFADDAGGNCHPSMMLIAARAGMARRSAQRMVRNLEKRRLIDVSGRGRGTSYSYYLRHGSEEWAAISISNSEAKERLGSAESSGQSVPNPTLEVRDNLSPTGSKKPEKVWDNLSEVRDNLSSSLGQSVIKFGTGCHPNQSRTGHEPVSEPVNAHAREVDFDAPKPKPAFELPDWVPADAWNGWIEMRKKKKAPPTDRACRLAVHQLEKLWDAGHDPGAVLDQSTMRGWTGIFPLSGDGNEKSRNRAGKEPTLTELWRRSLAEERAGVVDADAGGSELSSDEWGQGAGAGAGRLRALPDTPFG